ncbi:MAG: hypothetical protein H7330_02905 [Hymenobacteraceae bacterium]|nr:hypothetical protein [Hymenobacteraceae bacterium]
MIRLTFLLFLVCLIAQLLLPWWWVIAPICAAGGFWLGRTGGGTFTAGFLGVGLGWVLAATVPWLLTHSALPGRVASLLTLPGGGPVLVALAGVVSGLVGGLAALTGWWLRRTGGRGTFESAHTTPGKP